MCIRDRYMGFMETSLMRQLGKLVEVVRHANEAVSYTHLNDYDVNPANKTVYTVKPTPTASIGSVSARMDIASRVRRLAENTALSSCCLLYTSGERTQHRDGCHCQEPHRYG